MLDTKARKYFQPIFSVMAEMLIRYGVSAIGATLLALFWGVAAAITVYMGHHLIGVGLLWISGLFDLLDGTIARMQKTSSSLGTVLDVVFDRIVEILVLLALAVTEPVLAMPTMFVFASIILSMTVFLTVGAVAEKTGNKFFYYQPGLMERTEGLFFISAAVLFSAWRGEVLYLFAVLILFTAGQRFVEAVRVLK